MRDMLNDDSHWNETLIEAAIYASPHKLRELFVILLLYCEVSKPHQLWMNHRENMSEDFLHKQRKVIPDIHVDFSDAIFNQALIDIEDKLIYQGGQQMYNYGLPKPKMIYKNGIFIHYSTLFVFLCNFLL
eukprot:GHVR01123049.1.p1 GENE.GHVR01123049.1~~GHVR01123049.1.p1  ORF type:complete len:130 (+),score=5.51 GHVR01123049.1:349-738(+)